MKKEIFVLLFVLIFCLNLVSGINVTLESPNDDSEIELQAPTQEVSFKCKAWDDKNVSKISLYGDWHDNDWGVLRYDDSVNNDSEVILKDTLGFGNHIWNCEACDNESNCVFASNNFTFTLSSEEEDIFWKKTYVISNLDYEKGVNKKCLTAYRMRIFLNESYYFIGVTDVDDSDNSIDLNITNVGNVKMSDGEKETFDITNDDIDDFSLFLEATINGAAYLTLKKLELNETFNQTNSNDSNLTSSGDNVSSVNGANLNSSADSESINDTLLDSPNSDVVDSESVWLWWILGGLVVISVIVGAFFYISSQKSVNPKKAILNQNQQATSSEKVQGNQQEAQNYSSNSDSQQGSSSQGEDEKLPGI